MANFPKVTLYIRAQQAEAGPPLGTVLGNLGINATKFCKDFNEFTKELPTYFLLPVAITFSEDKSYSYKVGLPTVGSLVSLLRYERQIIYAGRKQMEPCISLTAVVELAQLKMPTLPLDKALPVVIGTVLAAGLTIVKG